MAFQREGSIVALVGPQAAPCGLGVLVGERHVLTCAHVVNRALGRQKEAQEQPGEDQEVQLRFPLLDGSPRRFATVAVWHPPPSTGVSGDRLCDVAGLELRGEGPPPQAHIAKLCDQAADEVEVFGYPQQPRRPDGAWVPGHLLGGVGSGRWQFDSALAAALRAQPGYSGSPVWTRDGQLVAGIFAAASLAAEERDGYLIPTPSLRQAWPDLLADRTVPPCHTGASTPSRPKMPPTSWAERMTPRGCAPS